MDRTEFFTSMDETYDELEALLSSIDEEKMLQPGVYDDLAIKDVIAHMAAWSRLAIGYVATSLRGEEPVWFAPGYDASAYDITDAALDEMVDALNARILSEHRDTPLAQALSGLRANHARLAKLSRDLTDRDLFDPDRFPWRHGRPLWTLIAWNDFLHFRDHIKLIRAWLERQG